MTDLVAPESHRPCMDLPLTFVMRACLLALIIVVLLS